MKSSYSLFAFLILGIFVIGMSHSAFAYPQNVRNYYIYVEPVPWYATNYASNAIYQATKAWQDANPDIRFYLVTNPQYANLQVQWVRDFGQIRNGQEFSQGVMQVGLGDSYCGQWAPFSSSYVTQIVTHEIGHFLGLQHTSNPNDIMYGGLLSLYSHGTIEKDMNLDTGYSWFIPVCTSKSYTSYSYTVSSSDSANGFDVYFVPSVNEFYKWQNHQSFQYYSNKGCSGLNWTSYSNSCSTVSQTSGLLIISHGNVLLNHLITIKTFMTEQ